MPTNKILKQKKGPRNAPRGKVRPADKADLPLIEKWLPKNGDIDTLASSWQITKKVFREGNLYVWEYKESDLPPAYCWGTLNSHSSVLEAHTGYRGRGIGHEMVAFMLMASVENLNPLLEIQCGPETSAVFWEFLGFAIFAKGHMYSQKPMDKWRKNGVGENYLMLKKGT